MAGKTEGIDTSAILEAIASRMQTGVLALDTEGKVIYANPFFLESFPVEGDITGRGVEEIVTNPGLLASVSACITDSCACAGDIEISEGGRHFKVNIERLTSDGHSSLLLFVQDVTEEKRVETIKKDFVANVSHELRTPLASIKGYSETLLDGGGMSEGTSREFLRIIDRHATRMARLIDDLLILSRLESHQAPDTGGAVDLAPLVASVVRGVGKQAGDKGLALTTDIPDDLPKVAGDRDRVEQVVVNLLDNAIKYTPSGGSVTVSAVRDDGGVRVDVTDTGIGIPEADIPRIFERFYRVDKARSRELGGTGLGLAIVKHIVQGLGGRIHVESRPGEGSRFSVYLRTAG